ncbi:MAG: GAF domain-containing SpoIIE family protein phosphatase [bacterium]
MQKTAGGLEREHDQRLVELQSLFELSTTLNSSKNLDSVLNTLLFAPMGRMLITQGTILLNTEKEIFKIHIVKGLSRDLKGKPVSIREEWAEPIYTDKLSDAVGKAFLQKHGLQLICPIMINDNCLGLIALGRKINGTDFTDQELEYLSSMANIAAPAVENSRYINELQDAKRQLEKKNQELNTLFDISKELNSFDVNREFDAIRERDKIANTLAYATMGELMVQKCLIFLKEADEKFFPLVVKGFRNVDEVSLFTNEEIKAKLATCQQAQLVEDIEDEVLQEILQENGLALIVPMLSDNLSKGCILVGGRLNAAPFQRDELEFLSTLGNSAMSSLENVRLTQENEAKAKLEKELSLAYDIQVGLLPTAPPIVDGFEFAGLNNPSLQVGGDYYDFIEIDENRIALAIGDVSGKGVAASLLMANLQASLRAMIGAKWPLSEIVSRINNIIHENTPFDKFITFFLAIVDTVKCEMTYVNAGHNPPYLFHNDGKPKTLEVGGLILGMMPNMPYEQATVNLQKDSWLLLFTDGVNEAMNENGDEYEEHRIEAFIQNAKKDNAARFIKELEKSVYEFCGSASQSDDITIVALRVKK